MARINSYNLDLTITNQDLVLGSSYEGTFNGVARYTTRNYRLEDLAEFFAGYDFNAGLSLTTIEGQILDINNSISSANSATSALDSRLTAAESSIASGTSAISALSSSISTNASNISSVTSSVQSLSNSLSTTQSTVSTISSNIANRSQWDQAYSWGDHSTQGYLTSVSINETDPVFSSSAAANVTNAKISNWDAAYQEAITGFDIQQNADGSQKTITLTRRDNTTLTDTAPDIYGIPAGTFTDTNYYVTSGAFSSGVLRLTRQGISGTVDVSGFDDRYALKSHTHTGYATVSHNHDGVYATVAHNHDGVYATAVHTHVAADITDLNSWFSAFGFVPATGGSFTGTVGFATSTNPSISSTISSSTFVLQAISSAIPTMGYSGLYLNANNAFELILKDANGNSNVFLTADGTSTIGGNEIWHSGNLNASSFLSTSGGTMTGLLNVNPVAGTGISVNVPSGNWAVRASSLSNALNASGIWMSSSNNASLYLRDSSGTLQTQINSSTTSTFNYGVEIVGSLSVGGNIITVEGDSPRVLFQENGNEDWYVIVDGGDLSVRKGDINTSKFVFQSDGTMSVRDQIALRNFTSTSNTDRFQIEPSNFAVGSPRFYIKKDSAANSYTVGLWDSSSNSGRIVHNADLISASEELSCSSLIFSPTLGIGNALSFWGTDGTDGFMPNRSEYLGTNRPSFTLTRHTTGSSNYAYTVGLSAIFKGNNITESFLFDKPNSTNLELQVGFPSSVSSITWSKLAHSKAVGFLFENSIGVESLYFENILSATSNAENIDSFMSFGTTDRSGVYSIRTTNSNTGLNNYPYGDTTTGGKAYGNGQAVFFKSSDASSTSANDSTFALFKTDYAVDPFTFWVGEYIPDATTGNKWDWKKLVHTGASFEWVGFTLTAQNFILNSDRRLKENIEDIRPREDVRWRQFEMGGKLRYGVVADEVEEIYPEFVEEGESGYKSVSYIDILVSENAKLRDRVESLEKDIEIIKKMLTK